MNVVSRLLSISNRIDEKFPQLADKLEKFAANMMDLYVPQSVLEKGYAAAGGAPINGSLGGFHTKYQLSGNAQINPQAITDAAGLIAELANELPAFEQWQQQHPNITVNPSQVYNILQVWQPFYWAGVTDIGRLQSVLGMSGPIDLQFATTSPSAAHQSWGITKEEIMQHEREHAKGTTSSPQEYMQHAIPGADFMETNGIGGNVNPVSGYYQQLMQNFMAGQGPGEYGPNLNIWRRIVRDKSPSR